MHVFAAERDELPATDGLDPVGLPAAGQPFPLPRETHATLDDLRRSYGAELTAAVGSLSPSSRYSEPIHSIYGWHRIRIIDISPGGTLPFSAVSRQLAFDLALRRREDTVRRFLTETAARYDIIVDGHPVSGFQPPLRLARHEAASGED
jgi:hypothetical protein